MADEGFFACRKTLYLKVYAIPMNPVVRTRAQAMPNRSVETDTQRLGATSRVGDHASCSAKPLRAAHLQRYAAAAGTAPSSQKFNADWSLASPSQALGRGDVIAARIGTGRSTPLAIAGAAPGTSRKAAVTKAVGSRPSPALCEDLRPQDGGRRLAQSVSAAPQVGVRRA